jgi:hypothetical protein
MVLQAMVISVFVGFLVYCISKLVRRQAQRQIDAISNDYRRLYDATSKALTVINSNGAYFDDMPDAEGKTKAWRELEQWWESEHAKRNERVHRR